MNENSVYILIAAVCILGACWLVRRMGRVPPPPTYLDDLNAELRQAQHDALIEAKQAEKSTAMAAVYQRRIARYKQEIEDERSRIVVSGRADVRSVGPGKDEYVGAGHA